MNKNHTKTYFLFYSQNAQIENTKYKYIMLLTNVMNMIMIWLMVMVIYVAALSSHFFTTNTSFASSAIAITHEVKYSTMTERDDELDSHQISPTV